MQGVKKNSSGVALVEAYDRTADSDSKLANISTKGRIETTVDNVMIGGFIVSLALRKRE